MMSEQRALYTFVLLVLSTPTLFARPHFASDNNHYFGIYGQGAYSRMHPFDIDVTSQNGYGVGGGILYEYENGAFLMDIGCGFVWQQAGVSVRDIEMSDQKRVDSQGTEYTLRTHVKRYDVYKRGLVDTHFMLGGQAGWFYGLVGMKVGMGLIEKSAMHARVTTAGVYDQYFVPFHDQANHGFRTDVPLETKHSMLPQMDIRGSVELGAWLGEIETQGSTTVKARVALFADYGLFLTKVKLSETFIAPGATMDINRYQQTPILVTKGNNYLDNLMVGVKLTVLIGGGNQSTAACRNCRLWNDNRNPIRHKNKCIICNDTYNSYYR